MLSVIKGFGLQEEVELATCFSACSDLALRAVLPAYPGSPIVCPCKLFLCPTSSSSWYLVQQKKNTPFPTLRQNSLHLLSIGHLHPLQLWLGACKLRGQGPLVQIRMCWLHRSNHSPYRVWWGSISIDFVLSMGHLCDKFSVLCGINTIREEKYLGWKRNRGYWELIQCCEVVSRH